MASIKANCRKVVCVGRNYADHITELNNVRPKRPFFFLKPPSSILPPNAGPVLRPAGVTLHYEVELGLVISRPVRDLSPTDDAGALASISAYFLAIDLTGRNVQDEAKRKGLPWSIAKGFDTFLPVSEQIASDRIKDPHNLTIWLSVDGETRQRDRTELMLFRVPRLLSDISQVMTLEEGDCVLTGTPKGVGPVREGEVMRCGIEDEEGREIEEGRIEVRVEGKKGTYEFSET